MNKILLYFSKPEEETRYYIEKALNPTRLDVMKEGFFLLEVDDTDSSIETVKSLMSDFNIDCSLYVYEINLPDNLNEYIYFYLKTSKSGIYKLNDVIEYNVLSNNTEFKQNFKQFFETKLSKEVIDTGLAFIRIGNSIQASKELFIHRNTLNYRIDTIKKYTSLDLRYFKDQLSFYGLFH